MFLKGDWPDATTGDRLGFALLFPMFELFEKFIARKLAGAGLGVPVEIQPKSKHALYKKTHSIRGAEIDSAFGRKFLFRLEPDLVVVDGDGGIVIDTKWKRLDTNKKHCGVSTGDIYQMLAYQRGYDARRLVLLYPWHSQLGKPGVLRQWNVEGSGTPLQIATVNVGDPGTVAAQLQQIVGNPHPLVCDPSMA